MVKKKKEREKKTFFFFFVAYWVYIMFILGPPSGRPRVVALYVCIYVCIVHTYVYNCIGTWDICTGIFGLLEE